MTVRKALYADIDAIEKIYNNIHAAEDSGKIVTGWITDVYPVRATAEASIERGDMFVYDDDGAILAAAIINKTQVDVYADGDWRNEAPGDKVCVLHTLVVEPAAFGRGIGSKMVSFYESYAEKSSCTELRLDTNARNAAARSLYKKLGYTEVGIVPCEFNGIPDVMLVLLEKKVGGMENA